MSMPFGRKGPLPPTEEILQSRCLSSPPPFQNPNSAQLPCTWCGRAASHGWNAVQRVMQTAISAEVKGHFQIMCRTKRVGMVQVEGDNNVFITTCARCGEESAIDLNTVPVQFKINTGMMCYFGEEFPGAKRNVFTTLTQVADRTQSALTFGVWPIHRSHKT